MTTPFCKIGNELMVDAGLEALFVGGVNEELGAVGGEEENRIYRKSPSSSANYMPFRFRGSILKKG